ncbi:TetR/AcrR family transcriptional regulator [Nocardioides speluncae]|uniref:TetR/AcrR family transcriptional regulator n=1 Tax=Nocardioides speluncae TaxID=2670337 RepID=UPI000D69C1BF|nr:TetR/AcrR family transcriptional regulator [Nocardioides speluncae]
MSTSSRTRPSYHHGDLRNALIEAGKELAASGGPEAVTVRAVAKAVGVTPTAAYRHFASHADLVDAVKGAALARLAERVGAATAAVSGPDPVTTATMRLKATGEAYLKFATEDTGSFMVAFDRGVDHQPGGDLALFLANSDTAFGQLRESLDELVRVGYLTTEARVNAEFVAWSVVHGLAHLTLSGPLSAMPAADYDALVDKALCAIIDGLHARSDADPARVDVVEP